MIKKIILTFWRHHKTQPHLRFHGVSYFLSLSHHRKSAMKNPSLLWCVLTFAFHSFWSLPMCFNNKKGKNFVILRHALWTWQKWLFVSNGRTLCFCSASAERKVIIRNFWVRHKQKETIKNWHRVKA